MDHYGYGILALGLMLEVLALPLPGEFLMSYAGLLVYQGALNGPLSILAASLGSSLGVTCAYWIGYKAGRPFFERFGPRLHLGPDKLDKVSAWFDRYGNKVLLIAYYIPGVRHFTGYFAGVTRLPFRTFALYAYTGAFVWTGLFITLGKILGPQWEHFHQAIKKYFLLAGVLAAVALAVYYAIKRSKLRVKDAALRWIGKGMAFFRTVRRLEWAIAASFVAFVVTVTWALSVLEDFLGHEFAEFDELAPLVVHSVFDRSWAGFMDGMLALARPETFAALIVAAIIAIWARRRDRTLAVPFYAVGLAGGAAGETALRHLFGSAGPGGAPFSFPSEPAILAVIVFGLSAYFAGRASALWWAQAALTAATLLAVALVGVAEVYADVSYASDVTAAFAFGGGWISSVIVLFELSLLLRRATR